MPRLPQIGSDHNQWGDILNEFLSVAHNPDGTLKADQVSPPGPQGPQGPVGPQGPQGPAGQNGTDGADGAAGPAGQDGAAGAQGPQGIQGPQGPQGPIGPEGPEGPAGPPGTTTWAGITDKPTEIAAGTTKAEARAAVDAVGSSTIATLWTGTQTAYDAIGVKDPATLYVIQEP